MSLLRTLAAEVAKVGETPNFITAMAHMWFACSVMLVLAHWGVTAWVSAPLCIALAAAKEFVFDMRYETTPAQTFFMSAADFAEYLAGIAVAILILLT